MTDIQFKVDTAGLEKAFALAPQTSYFWLRNALGSMFGGHRKAFLAANKVKFGSRVRGIVVTQVNRPPGGESFRHIVYTVTPTEARRPDAPIGLLAGDAYASSSALKALQEGATIRPKAGRMLAIPIKPRSGPAHRIPPRKFRETRLGKKAQLIPVRTRGGNLILVERRRRRTGDRIRAELTKSGRERARQRKTFRDQIIPRYVLVPQVKLPKALQFYESWDALAATRGQIIAVAADRIVKDLARGRIA